MKCSISVKAVHTTLAYAEGNDPIVSKGVFVSGPITQLVGYKAVCQHIGALLPPVALYPYTTLQAAVGFYRDKPCYVTTKKSGCAAPYNTTPMTAGAQTGFGVVVRDAVTHKRMFKDINISRTTNSVKQRPFGYAAHTIGVESKMGSKSVYVLNQRLYNTSSFVAVGVTVKGTIKSVSPVAVNPILKIRPLVGKWQEALVLPSEFGDIRSTTNLFGLTVSADNRSIYGIIGFTNTRRITVTLSDGLIIELVIEPVHIERLL